MAAVICFPGTATAIPVVVLWTFGEPSLLSGELILLFDSFPAQPTMFLTKNELGRTCRRKFTLEIYRSERRKMN